MKQKLLNKLWLRGGMLVAILCTLFAGQAWGQVKVGDTMWAETWTGATTGTSAGDSYTPSANYGKGTTVYNNGTVTYTQSSNSVYVRNENTGGGTKPELLLSSGKTWTISNIPTGGASELSLTYVSNNTKSSVTCSTSGASISGSSKSYTITTGGAATITLVFGCSGNTRIDNVSLTVKTLPTVAITSIAFSDPKTETIGVGGTVTLTPTVLPANYSETIDWESDATGVATVNSSGVVTGVAAGTAHITAKSHGNPSTIYDVCTVTVTAPIAVTGVSLKSSTTLLLGGTETLVPEFTPTNATNKNVTWATADNTKVSVDENGVITGLALTDTPVNITVTTEDGSFQATCAVTVNPVPVSSVGLNKTSAKLVIGKTLTLEATVSPDNATNKSVTWESDDTDVATVNSSGKVTAIAEGTATITVKSVADPTKKAECTITVTDGSIDLSTTGEITFGSWSQSILGDSYGDRECALTGSDGNTYYWNEEQGMYGNYGWQIKKTSGKVTSPVIKSNYGFTISTQIGTNDVVISDGTNSGKNTLTTTKTNTTITIQGDGAYAVFKKITITPLKAPVATDVAITDPGTLAVGGAGTFAYTAETEEDNTASWTSATTGVITITDAATGAYTAAGRGTSKITLTLTPDDATTYRAVTAERTVTVMEPVVITASNVEMTFGDAAKSIGATTSAGYAGTLTYESGNTSIATVDASGKVTAVAKGTTTITISAPADAEHLYTAGADKVIAVTVSAPTGGTTAPEEEENYLYYETISGNGTAFPTGWSGDGEVWYIDNSYGACSGSSTSVNGTSGETYDLVTCDYELSGYTGWVLDFDHTGKTFSSPSSACNVYVQEGTKEPVKLDIEYFAGDSFTWKEVRDIDLSTFEGKTVHFIFRYTPSDDNAGKWQIKNFGIYGQYKTISATLNASGYATFCSQYPLDFTGVTDFSAWQITNISTTNEITFARVNGSVKGGTGLFLVGGDGETVTIPSADSDNELSGNKLVGTMAPEYFEAGQIYGLSGDTFKKNNAGTIRANKAYIPAGLITEGGGAKEFTLIFDDGATGIHTVETVNAENAEQIFNLAGQRISKMQKGINIVNGKKVLY